MTTRIDGHEERRAREERLDCRVGAYRKPTLRRLGAWNVFTRSGSFSPGEDEDSGFFQFEVR